MRLRYQLGIKERSKVGLPGLESFEDRRRRLLQQKRIQEKERETRKKQSQRARMTEIERERRVAEPSWLEVKDTSDDEYER